MMRHLVEVMMVLEGRQSWARAPRGRRNDQGLLLPLPSMSSHDDDHNGDNVLRGLLMVMVEGYMEKEVMRMIVSFI